MMETFTNSSHNKEYNDIQFLNIGVTTAQLSPLLKYYNISYKIGFLY